MNNRDVVLGKLEFFLLLLDTMEASVRGGWVALPTAGTAAPMAVDMARTVAKRVMRFDIRRAIMVGCVWRWWGCFGAA